MLEGGGFNAFGERRTNGSATGITTTGLASTTRGFTGHEMLDDGLDVIPMNGRIYDPTLGRFLQADPVIQAPDNPQNWNAYTYVFNNPYKYTDPTGMIGQTERQWLGAIIGIGAAIFTGGASFGWWATSMTVTQAFAITVAAGFASGAIATQSFKGGLYGAFGAALTFGVGWAGMHYDWGAGTMLAQAAAGGVLESIQGGSFGNGFIAAGMAAALMPGIGNIGNPAGRAIVGALIGGTLSAATGGKFVNGAVSGAVMGAMSGRSASGADCADCRGGIGKPVGARHALDRANPNWRDNLSVVQEGGVTVVRGQLTVSGPGADYAARDVTAVWGNASGEYEGVKYRSEITMTALKKGGDWAISRWNKGDWMRFNETLCSGIAGAKVDAIGGSRLIVPPINSVWQQSGTPAHEFGHGMGLSHAPPGSGSIMSYDAVRTVTGRDIYNLSGGYR